MKLGHDVRIVSFDELSGRVVGRAAQVAYPLFVAKFVRQHAGRFDVLDLSTGDGCYIRPHQVKRSVAGCFRMKQVTLIDVVPHAWIMIDRNGRVIEELPTAPLDREGKRQFVVHLRAFSTQFLVESQGLNGSSAKAPICTLEHVNLARWAHSQMMIPDDSTEPLNLADHASGSVDPSPILVHPIPAAQPAELRGNFEMGFDACEPVRVRSRIVIRDRDDIAASRVKARI